MEVRLQIQLRNEMNSKCVALSFAAVVIESKLRSVGLYYLVCSFFFQFWDC